MVSGTVLPAVTQDRAGLIHLNHLEGSPDLAVSTSSRG